MSFNPNVDFHLMLIESLSIGIAKHSLLTSLIAYHASSLAFLSQPCFIIYLKRLLLLPQVFCAEVPNVARIRYGLGLPLALTKILEWPPDTPKEARVLIFII